MDENTATNENIGDPVAATDDDSDTLTYSLDATSAASFDIDADGQLQTKADLDYETKRSYTVTVSVSDSKDDNSDADEVTDDTITPTILVANRNEAPVFTTSDLHHVDENTPAGENIGAPVAATDDDSDTLTYSLDLTSRATFKIVANTASQTKAVHWTDADAQLSHRRRPDPSDLDSIDVTITVNNGRSGHGHAVEGATPRWRGAGHRD